MDRQLSQDWTALTPMVSEKPSNRALHNVKQVTRDYYYNPTSMVVVISYSGLCSHACPMLA
jgi:hypothetical protein